jgi:chloramphenicol 3-O-phosphotransferase
MTLFTPGILLITGIMAAGKSTVAQAVAERLPMSVHLRGDVFRRMVVSGRAEMEPKPSEEALAQLRLRYRLSVMTADLYCQAGFTVIYQDVILGPMLSDVVELFEKRPLHVVVLCPSPEIVAQREAERAKTGYGDWTPEMLDQSLHNETPHIGLWLDTSDLTVEETVDAIFAQIDRAVISR